MIELAPSILSADFARLGEDAQAAVEGGATVLHVDIMDGHFVPNLTIGPPVVASLRKVTRVPLDCHLMIERPRRFHTRIRGSRRQLDFGPSRSLCPSRSHAPSNRLTWMQTRRSHKPRHPSPHPGRGSSSGSSCSCDERESRFWRSILYPFVSKKD